MIRALRAALAVAGVLLTTSIAAGQGTPAADGIRSVYERALQIAQSAADQAQKASDAALREADAAMAALDMDSLNAQAFLAREIGAPTEIVKNAPYTAQALTETTQVLMDGNRIVHRSVTLLARDSAGRTRQERKTDRGSTAYIYDPVENRSYVLHAQDKIAQPLPRTPVPAVPAAPPALPTPPSPPSGAVAPPDSAAITVQPGRVVIRKGEADANDVSVEVIRVGRDDEAGDANARVRPLASLPAIPPLTLHGHSLALPYAHADRGVSESLGSRDFDGIRADGKRTTRTIPAGAIGNEKPIAIVSERWFSPELNVVVMSRTVDPRSGETVYRLTDIKRGEPAPELFRIPADYKVRAREHGTRSR